MNVSGLLCTFGVVPVDSNCDVSKTKSGLLFEEWRAGLSISVRQMVESFLSA